METPRPKDLQVIEEIIHLYHLHAQSDYIGEPITQLEHSLQCADWALKAKATEEEVLAALFHDIGHLCGPSEGPQMGNLGVLEHERVGAQFLQQRGFSPTVVALVQGHIEAKRYLIYKHSHYREKLSQASWGTLQFQGGPMQEQEALIFEKDPLFAAKLRLRQWDELSKEEGKVVAVLENYRAMMARNMTLN